MTQRSRFWDGIATGDATEAPYDAATEFAAVMRSVSGGGGIATNLGGVFRGELNGLAVTGAASPVAIDTGRAINYGTWFENDASTTIAIPTPAVSTRVDVIVLRKDWVAQTVRITRVAGTEGAGVPAITQVAGVTWDIPLANVSIVITTGVITLTDRRQFLGYSGGAGAGTADQVLQSDGTNSIWRSVLRLAIGAVGAPAMAWAGDLTTGWYSPGAGQIAAALAGVQKWLLNASGLMVVYQVPEARAYNNANLSIANITVTALTLNSERYDTDTIHDTGSNTSRLTCKTAGKYRITLNYGWAGSAAGTVREVGIRLNGTTALAYQDKAPSTTVVADSLSTVYDLAVNDYVEAIAYQDSGGALNVVTASAYSPEFMMERVG